MKSKNVVQEVKSNMPEDYCTLYKDLYHDYMMWVFHADNDVWFSLSSIRENVSLDDKVLDKVLRSLPASAHTILPLDLGFESHELECVTIDGLDKLIQVAENKKQARVFYDWVKEILHPIEPASGTSKVGSEVTQSELEEIEKFVGSNRNKLFFADAFIHCDKRYQLGEVVKIIVSGGIPITLTDLMDWMKEEGFLTGEMGTVFGSPTRKSIVGGLLVVNPSDTASAKSINKLSSAPLVTGKGLVYFVAKADYIWEA